MESAEASVVAIKDRGVHTADLRVQRFFAQHTSPRPEIVPIGH